MTWQAEIAQQIINGLSIGMIYALIALGYTMVYGIIRLINFAHGEVFMVGSFIAFLVLTAIGATSASSAPVVIFTVLFMMAAAMGLCGLLGAGLERLAYRPLRHAPRLAPLITAIGASLVLQNAVMIIFGPSPRHFPEIVPGRAMTLMGVHITFMQFVVITTSVILMLLLHWFITNTRTGKSLRATSQDIKAASLVGINVNRSIAICFFIGSSLGAAGGVIYGMYYARISFFDGYLAGMKGFTAAVLGGIGNIPGAMFGGWIIGVVEALGAGYISSAWKDVFAFIILVAVLLIRPTGLFGRNTDPRA